MIPARRLLALLLVLGATAGCGGSGDGGQTNPAPGPGTTTTDPFVARDASPPVGLTWHVGITEDVTLAAMQSFHATLVAANSALWNVSEGQVRVHAVTIRDRVAPGITAATFIGDPTLIDTSDLDVLVWPGLQWDLPAEGAVSAGGNVGRANRLMLVPLDSDVFVLLHESSHLVWSLTWFLGPLLFDEYLDDIQDDACVMESENLPLRWCSDANHVDQASQPHACWQQILADYPNFAHRGQDTASGLPPAPTVDYTDS